MQARQPSATKPRDASIRQAAAEQEWLQVLAERAPALLDCIDPARLEEGRRVLHQTAAVSNDFDSSSRGGRGESYRHAQMSMFVRAHGIQGLFNLLSPERDYRRLPRDCRILDVLGGDGLLARVMARVAGDRFVDGILTSDLSEDMVRAAAAAGLVPICQAAQYLVLKDACLDGVILAYGTHHIPRQDRLRVCREAHRVLKPGGKVLLHDFEEGSPVALWFSEVVERYSRTGHEFPHFTAAEIDGYLSAAGFSDGHVECLYDPFVLTADSESEARRALASYLISMYGLELMVRDLGYEAALDRTYELAEQRFRYDYRALGLDAHFGRPRIELEPHDGQVRIELPRLALVGVGTK